MTSTTSKDKDTTMNNAAIQHTHSKENNTEDGNNGSRRKSLFDYEDFSLFLDEIYKEKMTLESCTWSKRDGCTSGDGDAIEDEVPPVTTPRPTTTTAAPTPTPKPTPQPTTTTAAPTPRPAPKPTPKPTTTTAAPTPRPAAAPTPRPTPSPTFAPSSSWDKNDDDEAAAAEDDDAVADDDDPEEAPSCEPLAGCADSTSWSFEGGKNCADISEDTATLCSKRGVGGVRARDACPVTCCNCYS